MRNSCLLLIAVAALIVGARPAAHSAPDDRAATCSVSGRVTSHGAGVQASIEVRLRQPIDPHFRGRHYRTESVVQRLAEHASSGDLVCTVRSEADGVFAVENLPPGYYSLRTEAPERGWCTAAVGLLVTGQHAEVELPLAGGTASVEGRALRRAGVPYVGTLLVFQGTPTATSPETALTYEVRTTTTAEGRFSLQGLANRATTYVTIEPGRLTTHRRAALEPKLELVLEDPSGAFEGVVLDVETRAPIQGASVAWRDMGWGSDGIARTGPEGRFALPRGPGEDSPRQMFVRAAGYGALSVENPPHESPYQILLRREARVTGVVVDEAGQPVPGLMVHADHRSGPHREHGDEIFHEHWHAEPIVPSTTDASGRFQFEGLCWGTVRLLPWGKGFVARDFVVEPRFGRPSEARRDRAALTFDLHPGETTEVRVVVRRGATIRGRVRDSRGRPVVGVPVHPDSGSWGDPRFQWEGVEFPPLVATSTDGSFEIDGLLAGTAYELVVRPAGYAPFTVKQVQAGGEDAAPVEIQAGGPWLTPRRMEAGAPDAAAPPIEVRDRWIALTVVDAETGEPVPGARVAVFIDSGRYDRDFTTDDKGHARLGPFGDVRGHVNIDHEGYLGDLQTPFPAPTPQGTPMTIRLSRGAWIRGRVLASDGSPDGKAYVHARNLGAWGAFWNDGSRWVEDDGSFALGPLGPGPYEVTARRDDETAEYASRTQQITPPQQDVVLQLEEVPGSADQKAAERARLRVRILDARGRAIDRARVTLEGAGGSQQTRPMRGGVATFEKDPHPEDRLTVMDALDADGYRTDAGVIHDLPIGKTTGELTVHLPPGRALSGRLLDAAGRPLPNVLVEAVRVGSAPPDQPAEGEAVAAARTRADGHFRWRALGEEDVEVRVTPPPGLLAPWPPLRTRPGPDAAKNEIAVQLREAPVFVLTVVDTEDRPLADIVVAIGFVEKRWDRWTGEYTALAAVVEGTTNEEGTVRLQGLDPLRSYEIELTNRRRRMHQTRRVGSRWTPATATLTWSNETVRVR